LDEKVALYKQEQYRDLLQEAELFRLAHPKRDGCSEGGRFYRQVLAGLAHYLTGWVARLRKRHEEAPAFPARTVEMPDTPCP
jgi:hypothetical protein